MKRRDIESRNLDVLGANPISTVISPRLVNNEWLTVIIKRDAVVIEVISFDVTDTLHRAKYFI
jgi:hypothetical protein